MVNSSSEEKSILSDSFVSLDNIVKQNELSRNFAKSIGK